MNNISVTPKGGTIASVLNGNNITLTSPSVVQLKLEKSDIKSYTRNGNDLIVTTKSGDVLVIHNFYGPNGASDLVLEDHNGALWWVEHPGEPGFEYLNIDSTEGLLAENTTHDGAIAAFGLGGAALAGIAAMFAGSSSGGGGGGSNTGGDTGGGGDNGGGNNGGGGGNNGGGGGDTTAPGVATNLVLTDTAGSIQGAISNGSSTDDTTPTLTGTAEAGSTVSIYDGSTLLGTVTVGSDGTWSYTTPTLGEGSHSLTTTVTDPAGNTSAASDPINFTVDTIPPAVASDLVVTDNVGGTQGPLTSGSSTDDNTPTLSGKAEAGSTVSIYDGTTLLGTVTVGANGDWSFTTPALSNGSHSLSVTVTDAAGNVSAATPAFDLTVDALAPATTSLQVTDDSGNTPRQLGDGASTHDNTPILSGLTTANAVITLYDGNTLLGSVVAGSDGQWVFTPTTLADGQHSFHATIIDANGNQTVSNTIIINIDTVAPEAAGDLNLSNNDGSTVIPVPAGSSTNDTTPLLTGTAEPGSTVTVSDGTTVLGTVVVGSDGNWSFTTPTLGEGQHSLTTTVTDPAGNTSPASDPLNFTVDTTPPAAASGLTVTDNVGDSQGPITSGASTDDNTPTLSGQAEPNSLISIYDGTTLLGNTTTDVNGNWSFTTPALTNGSHSLTVTVTDTAGNVSAATPAFDAVIAADLPPATTSLQVTDDSGNTLISLADGASTQDSTPVLSGLAGANNLITLYDGTTLLGSVVAGDNGQWSFTPTTLADGSHDFHATITDSNSNVTDSVTINITIDTQAPAAAGDLQLSNNDGSTVVPITAGGATNDSSPLLSGTAEPGTTVTISDGTTVLGTVTVNPDGSWSYTTPQLTDGNHSLTTTVTDAAGNTSPASAPIAFTVDTTPPAAVSGLVVTDNVGDSQGPLTSGGFSDDNTPTLSGQAEANSVVSVYDGDTLLGTVTVGSDGNWSFTPEALTNGSHSLTATVTDAAGNVSPATTPFNVTINADLPPATSSLQVTDDTGNTLVQLSDGDFTHDSTPVLSGLATANSLITLYDGTTVLGSVTADGNGQWVFTPTALADGAHAFQASITDINGNVTESATINITIDTVATGATGGLQLSNDESGTLVPIEPGSATNDNTPVLSGSAEPNAIVSILDGDTLLGTTTADTDGNWSFTLPTLTEGDHSLTTTVTDQAGNTSDPSSPFVFTVDTTPPAAADNVQLSNDSSGTSVPITSGATNDTTPVLSGTAEPGTTVTVSDGGTVLGTTTVDSDGNWSFTTPTLDEGDHSLTTTVTDPAGNTGPASSPVIVNVDTTAPDAAGGLQLSNDLTGTPEPIADGGVTNDTTPVLNGTAEPGSTVTVSDGSTVLGTATADNNGNWSFTTTPLGEGDHSLTATVTDPAGNTSAVSDPVTVTIDTTAPAVAGDVLLSNDETTPSAPIAAGGATNDTTPVLSGTADPGSTVTVSDNGSVLGTAAVDNDGNWSFTTPELGEGAHSLTATVTDPAGNTSPPTTAIDFTVDTTAPAAATGLQLSNDESGTSVPIAAGGTTNDTTPVLSGSAEPGSTVTVSDGTNVLGTATVDGNGNWSFTTPALDEGAHSLTTTVTDAAGNTGVASDPVAVIIDTTAPAAAADLLLSNDSSGTSVPVTSGSTNDITPVLSGTAEAGSTVTVSDGSVVLGTATVDGDGNWSFTTPELSEGSHSLTTTVTDPAGNTSTASDPVAFTVDTQPPAAAAGLQLSNDSSGTPVPIAAGGATNDTTPVLSGTAEPGSTVTVSDGTNVLGTAAVDGDGNWSFTTPALDEGAHSLTATVTDAAGNAGPASDPIAVTIDTTAPAAADNLQLSNDNSGALVPITTGATNDTTPVLSGTAEAGSTVTVSDGTTVLGTAIVDTDGNWSFTSPTLDPGAHSLTTTVTDPAGNTGIASDPILLTVDTSAPDPVTNLTATNDDGDTLNGLTNDSTPTLSGTAEAGSIISIYDNMALIGTVLADATTGSWSVTLQTLTDGDHNLMVTETDAAGNISAPSNMVALTVDTTAPDVADFALNNNNGSTEIPIANGGITNDNSPVLSGTTEPNSLITIYDGTDAIGSVTTDGSGNWSFITTPLLDGSHALSITVTDAAGNTGPSSAALNFDIDTTAPDPVTDLVVNNNEGSTLVPITDGNLTNDATPELSGTAEAGSIVSVYDGTTLLGTTSAGADGSWTFTTSDLGQGPHSLSVTVSDAAGNTSANSTTVDFTVDSEAPAAADNLLLTNDQNDTPIAAGGSTNDNTPVLSGTAEANSIVTVSDGSNVLGTAITDADGNWSFTTPILNDGAHSLSVTVADVAGNVSDPSAPIALTVDTVAPSAVADLVLTNDAGTDPVDIPNGGLTNDNTPVLSGSAEAGSIIVISDENGVLGSVTVGDGGSWNFTPSALADGSHTLSVTATDAAGNASVPATISLEVDATAPDAAAGITLSNDNGTTPTTITNGSTTGDSTPLLAGTAEVGSTVTILDGTTVIGTVLVDSNGQWSFSTPTLSDASHSLSVTVTDAAGNTSAASTPITFTVDTAQPDATSLVVSNDNGTTPVPLVDGATTNDNTPLLTGTAEANSIITVYDGTVVIGSAAADGSGNWSFSAPTLTDGTHTLSATVTDTLGNVSTASTTITVAVDATAPEPVGDLVLQNNDSTPSVVIADGGTTNDDTPELSGTAEANSIITVYDGTTLLGTTTSDGDGNWSYTTSSLSNATHTLNVTVTDEAGNVSSTTSITVTVDNQVPDPVSNFAIYDNDGTTPVLIANNGSTNDDTPVLRGNAAAGNTINIFQDGSLIGIATVADNGTWRFETTALTDGPYTYTVSVTDAAGNTSAVSADYTVTIDTVAPDAVSDLVVTDDAGAQIGELTSGDTTDDNTPTLSGSAVTGEVISIYDGTTLLGTVTAAAGAWSFTPAALSNGSHSFTVTVTDAAGNVSAASSPAFDLTISAGQPPATSTLEITDDSGSTLVQLSDGADTKDNTPVLSGVAAEDDVITIHDGATVLGSVLVDASGQWTFTPAPALADGGHALYITTVDGLGNPGVTSDTINITVDTAVPATVADLVVSNDSSGTPVVIADGSSTNDSTPLLTGTAEANAVITIYDGTSVVGSTSANASGIWSYNTPTLSNGSHTLSVTATDAAGNASPNSASVTFTVDTHAPAAATLVVTNDVTSTVVPNGGSTNDSTPTLSGTAEANSVVTIYDGTTVLGSATASAGGIWSFTTAALAEGSHALSVRATDAAGNVSVASSTATVVIDTVAPAAVTLAASNNNGTTAIPIANNGTTNDNTPALSGTAEAGSKITISDGTTVLGTVTAGSNGAWSFTTSTLADGTHTLNVTATDAAGNVSPNAAVTLTVDTGVPTASTLTVTADNVTPNVTIPSGGSTNDNTPTLSGTAEAGAVVTISDGSTVLGSVTAGAGGAWSFTTAALANGSHPLSVTVKDAAGNVSPATSATVIVDTVAPTASTLVVTNDVTSTVVPNGGSTNDNTPTLSGTAEVGSRVTISDGTTVLGSVTVGAGGTWSFIPTALLDGTHPLSVTVTDAAGNVSGTTSATVIIDTVAPVAVTLAASNNNGSTPVAIANNGTTNDSTPGLSGTAEAGSKITISDGTTVLGTVTAGSNGAWSFTTSTLADGTHTLNVTATDAAGNVSPNASVTLTVDTGVPTASTLTVTADNVTPNVTIPSGGYTNDNTPTLSGTAEAGAVVTISDGSTVLGSVTAGAGGAWTFTTAALANGSHPLSVTVKDAAGNVSPATSATVIVDTVAPTASTLVITNDAAGVVVPSGGSTNDSTPVLSGTAEVGSKVTISDGSTVLGTVTVGAGGTWSFTTATLSNGTHPLSVTVTDLAGNVSGTTSASVIIDTVAPAAVTGLAASNNNGSTPVAIPNNGSTNDNTPALNGTAEAGSKVAIYDGSTLLGTVTAGSNGAWSFTTSTLADGTHTLNVTATDAAGNVSPNASVTLTVDTGVPTASTLTVTADNVTPNVTIPSGGYTNDNTPTLSGTAEAGAVVTISDGSTVLGSVTAGAGGAWSFTTAALANGTHPLSVTVKDAAGNVSPATAATVIVDTVAPTASTLVITNDAAGVVVPSGGSTNDSTPVLSGTAEVGSKVTIYDGSTVLGTLTVGGSGTWSFTTATLSNGTHPLSVTVTDLAGNVSGTTSASVIIDTVAPAAVTGLAASNNNGGSAVTIPNNGTTNDNTPLLSGTAEAGAKITIYDGATLLGTTTAASSGAWSFTTSTLTEGTHTLNVTATDAAGNVSPNASVTLTVDSVAPGNSTLTVTNDSVTPNVTVPSGGYTRDTTPVLSGTAEVGSRVTIYDGATIIGSVTVGASGTWSFTTAVLADGSHSISVTATDAAGNVSGITSSTVIVDTVAPTAATALAVNTAGTTLTGTGEAGTTVTVKDAGGNTIGTGTVGVTGSFSVTLTTAQTTGATLSVSLTDAAGNTSPTATVLGAIKIIAVNDAAEVDYSTTTTTVNNGTTSVSHTSLLSANLGSLLGVNVLSNGNAYLFSVGNDDTRTVTLNGATTTLVGLIGNYTLYLYQQQTDGTWALKSSTANYITTLLTIGTQTGANVTYSNLGTGTYAVVLGASTGISVLPTTTITTVTDTTVMAVTVAATVTGNLLTNDTSSVAGTVPAGTAVTSVSGHTVGTSTSFSTTYGTLTIDSHGNYTYTLKAGVDIDTLPAADTFSYSVTDAQGVVTTATLSVSLVHATGTASLLTANSLFVESVSTTDSDHSVSGSIWADSSTSHTGTLTITNEHGDSTTVLSSGHTVVAGDYGSLSIAADGSYTYALSAEINAQSITHKEVFSYTLASTDGTLTSNSFTIELHPTITGTAAADTLTSSAYDDTITSGAGTDTLVYHLLNSADATGGNGHDTWTDFSVTNGDKIDVSNLLIGWNDDTSNINDFVKVDHTADGSTVLSIDRDGTGTAYSSTQLVTLEGTNASLEELLQQPHQTHTA
ncbi:Ig-like domain-containing protein [Pantoea cypripedii]|uniref:Ig-like domain repeat protein n=1 Tax=Pantoea cypripedii TaxID=55209 RepID=A0A6B9G5Q7_PANCY|nr:Ig-like domain-containing protein [Pantoea cypripedii]QGY30450.1 Ig-like domain repeat protein [Pantoea cypripedii]